MAKQDVTLGGDRAILFRFSVLVFDLERLVCPLFDFADQCVIDTGGFPFLLGVGFDDGGPSTTDCHRVFGGKLIGNGIEGIEAWV